MVKALDLIRLISGLQQHITAFERLVVLLVDHEGECPVPNKQDMFPQHMNDTILWATILATQHVLQ